MGSFLTLELWSVDYYVVPGNLLASQERFSEPKLVTEPELVGLFYKLRGLTEIKSSVKLFDSITTEFVPTIKNL